MSSFIPMADRLFDHRSRPMGAELMRSTCQGAPEHLQFINKAAFHSNKSNETGMSEQSVSTSKLRVHNTDTA